MQKTARTIVDSRKLIFVIFLIAVLVSGYTMTLTTVENDLYLFLPEETETRQGLKAMDGEFITYATAQVMVKDISVENATKLAEKLGNIEGVRSAVFDESEQHYKDGAALITLTFAGAVNDEISLTAAQSMRDALADTDGVSIYTSVGTNFSTTLLREMLIVGVLCVVIVIALLLLTSRSYAEVPVLLITFAAAAMIQQGTNFVYSSISYVANSVTLILQLALAIDYAIILCNRFAEERQHYEAHEAAVEALAKAIPEIASSSLTTIGGLIAMTFMQFGLGGDLGKVLIKSILISMITVFTLMPGLLLTFSGRIEKTAHRSFMPRIDGIGRFAWKTRRIVPPLFICVAVAAFYFSAHCPFLYNYSDVYPERLNETQAAHKEIIAQFGDSNMVALIVPSGDYEKETQMLDEISQREHVTSVLGIASVDVMNGYRLSDRVTLDEFAGLAGLDDVTASALFAYYGARQGEYDAVETDLHQYKIPLIDLFMFMYDIAESGTIELPQDKLDTMESLYSQLAEAKKQLQGKKYSRMLVYSDTPAQSEESYALIKDVHNIAASYYGDDVYVTGDTVASRDLEESFSTDNILVSGLSALFVVLVVLCVFRSAGLALLLIVVILGSIWLNFSIPYFTGNRIFFVGYLIVGAIQMGANIDYAIVISNRYLVLRQQQCSRRKAIRLALNGALPTLVTSGSILVIAGLLIGYISTEGIISVIGVTLGRGTLISLALVLFVLPQMLVWGDKIIGAGKVKNRRLRIPPIFADDFEQVAARRHSEKS